MFGWRTFVCCLRFFLQDGKIEELFVCELQHVAVMPPIQSAGGKMAKKTQNVGVCALQSILHSGAQSQVIHMPGG